MWYHSVLVFLDGAHPLRWPERDCEDNSLNYMQSKESESTKYRELINFEYLSLRLTGVKNEANLKFIISCQKLLTRDVIDVTNLTKQVQKGFDTETQCLRGIVWRLILGYLVPNRKLWISMLENNRDNYNAMLEENIKKVQQAKMNDHPLSRSQDSVYNNHFQDQQLMGKIQKDVVRTRQKELAESRDQITRIIFLWCKLNRCQYVQGMNEIAALIYLAFYNDVSATLRSFCESDSFYCFSIVMTTQKQNFLTEDNAIFKEQLRLFSDQLKKIDPKLHEHFTTIKLDLSIFYHRWFITMLAQSLQLEDSLRVWDTIFAQPDQQTKNDMFMLICVSILTRLREELLVGQFGEAVIILQTLERQNLQIDEVISKACIFQREYRK